jgi:hypothetical protein
MNERRPIDIKRDSGGSADIGTEQDGAILEMYNLDGKLIVIKEFALYEFMTADTVDPDRTNISLPNNIQRLLINQGAESELVGRTFLTTKTLVKKELFKGIDTSKIIKLSLDALVELTVLEKEVDEYLEKEKEVSHAYEERRKELASYAIPSINDVETRCKTIFQKADHVEQILMEIITLFYPNEGLTKQSHFPKFQDILKKKYGEADPFFLFLDKSIYFIKVVRELRNSLDHRLKFVKVKDFELQTDSNIISPTIELEFKEVKLEKVSLSEFLPLVLKNSIYIFENTIGHLSATNAKSDLMPYVIKEIPENDRRYKHVRYSFWSPLGDTGYFHQ